MHLHKIITLLLSLQFITVFGEFNNDKKPINYLSKKDSTAKKYKNYNAKGSAGLHFGRILGQNGNMQGIEANISNFRYLSINNNNVVTSNYFNLSADTIKKIQSLTYCYPIKQLSFGNRFKGISGYSIVPKIGLGLAQKIDGLNTKNGLNAMASLTLHVPYFMVEAGIDANYVGLNKNSGGKQMLIYPHVSFKFDALFEILGLSLNIANNTYYERFSNTTYSDFKDIKNINGDKIGESYTATTTSWSESVTTSAIKLTVDPFWGIAPRYSYVGSSASVNQNMYGLSIGFRGEGFGIDAYIETGNIAYKGNKKKSYLHNPFPEEQEAELSDPTFLASGSGTMMMARLSFDPILMLRKAIFKTGGTGKPGALRVLTGGGIGYAILGKPKFINPYANAVKDAEFLNEPDLWESPSNDARLSKSGIVYSIYASVELGAIGFEISQYIFNKYNAPLAVGLFKTITYAIPIKQTRNAYKALKKERKTIEEKI